MRYVSTHDESRHDELVEARQPKPRYAVTVRGLVHQQDLGVVLPHEHILFDLRVLHEPWYPDLAERPVALDMLGRLRRHPTTCLDNLVQDDPELAMAELRSFSAAGGRTVVDLTSDGPRIAIEALPRIALQTELHIIVGAGAYSPAFYPDGLDAQPVDQLADQLTLAITDGIGGSAIRAGILGKLELPDPATAAQEKVLRAAARASQRTGAPIAIDVPPGPPFDQAHRILTEEAVSPEKVLLCGMDDPQWAGDRRRTVLPRAADRGYYLLFDGLGKEWYVRGGEQRLPRDPERLRLIKELVEGGHLRQVLLSQGIDRKMLLRRYGGWGYAHISENLLPMMVREQFAPKQITTMMMYNPARVLAFAS